MSKNVIVGQSGGPTAVINSSLAGVYQTARDRGAHKIYGMLNGIQGLLEHRIVDLSKEIKGHLEIELLKRTPSAFLGSCRYRLPEIEAGHPVYEAIFELLEKLEISHFFYIGGNDSMDTINKLTEYGKILNSDICFMGVPKTIDNDLAVTDHTPGFGSAAKYVAAITKEVIKDALVYDIPTVTILEIMGRNAGWLTAATALAKDADCQGPDLIFLPETPFEWESFIERVKNLQTQKKAIVVAVSEGIRLADGRYVCELSNANKDVDAFGHKNLAGTAVYLAEQVRKELGCKTRAVECSTLQRCAAHLASRVDVTEAFQVGGAAVKAGFEGQSGKMVILKRVSDDPYICITDLEAVDKIANLEKKVPMEWIDQEKGYVTQDVVNYIKPLIQAELSPVMVSGLPAHLTLSGEKVTIL